MRLSFIASVALAAMPAVVCASDNDSASYLVPSPHGGYNVNQGGGRHGSIAFFGMHGFAAHVIAHSHDKPKYVLTPGVEDVGHGSKIVVYKRVYYATAEEAEAARLKQ